MKMKNRIFFSIFAAAFLALALALALAVSVMYGAMSDEVEAEVRSEAEYLSAAVDSLGEKAPEYLSEAGAKSENRITLCAPDGRVLYDNFADPDMMENHAGRPEIAAAMEHGSGSAARASDTLGERTYYYAVRLDSGGVLRIADTGKNAAGLLGGSAVWIVLAAVLVIAVSAAAAVLLTRTLIRPINNIDPDDPFSGGTYDELSPLLARMDKQNKAIGAQMSALAKQKDELAYIMEGMSEGLVIFGEGGRILSANTAAGNIFGAPCVGTYIQLCRDKAYTGAVESALGGSNSSAVLERAGRTYRLSASPVPGQDGASGEAGYAVLFAVDITEQENAERMRREFSANVSHELKTPLTSVMGAAELIETGLAKAEDVPRFAGKIHSEAKRLLSLIEDIIKLSRLDEGGLTREFETLRLDEICRSVLRDLSAKAAEKGVALHSDLEEYSLQGVRPVLYEMVYNLCDNGITYNKPVGNVTVTLRDGVLTVADDGIGIPAEHQGRIFERFYRVDKSRSKETGGTGLGLSIVKHGAALHGGVISLKSEAGAGTEVSIDFQNKQ